MRISPIGVTGALALVMAIVPGTPSTFAQDSASIAGVPVHSLVTVEARHGKDIPAITRDDVKAFRGHDREQVTDLLPLQGTRAGLELFILIDDASDPNLGLQLDSIREFINAQSASTSIGIGYMRDGMVEIAQNLTTDHLLAAKALRLPQGFIAASSSPYFSVVDLMKRWPESQVRQEILMITDGIDRYYCCGLDDPYVDTAIQGAQRRGIVIYSIYARGEGHYGHSFWRVNWGQNYLAEVAEQTGGESYYFLSAQNPVSFAPYLDDLSIKLNHQYLLTFLAKPQKKAGFQQIKLLTEVPNAELVAADQVYVSAGK